MQDGVRLAQNHVVGAPVLIEHDALNGREPLDHSSRQVVQTDVFTTDPHNLRLAGLAGNPNHHVPQRLGLRDGQVRLDPGENLVDRPGLDPALRRVDDRVGSRAVKPHLDLPVLDGNRKLRFVAVKKRLFCRKDRPHVTIFEQVAHPLVFEAALRLVADRLHLAASASLRHRANRIGSRLAFFMERHHFADGVFRVRLYDPDVGLLARKKVIHVDDLSVHFAYARAQIRERQAFHGILFILFHSSIVAQTSFSFPCFSFLLRFPGNFARFAVP